jgi:hypothetical protein
MTLWHWAFLTGRQLVCNWLALAELHQFSVGFLLIHDALIHCMVPVVATPQLVASA